MSELSINPEQRKAVAERLEKIRARNGGVLTPEHVVEDARSVKSPLHEMFPWSDKEAAHKHRLDIAREIIRHVRVEICTETRTFSVPRYVRDPRMASDEQGYAAVAEIKDDRDVARDALLYEFKRAVALLERACDIADGLGLGEEVTELVKRMRVLQERVKAA